LNGWITGNVTCEASRFDNTGYGDYSSSVLAERRPGYIETDQDAGYGIHFCRTESKMAHSKSSSTTKTSQSQPKKPRTSVPPPQAARIASRFISGQSIRQISREEHRDRETVKSIVQGPCVREYILMLRTKFFEVGADAVDAVQHQLRDGKDGRLGLEVLRDVGVVPTKREVYEILHKRRSDAGTDPKSDRFGRLTQPKKLVQ
jgi:hypothetical protein